MKVVHTADVHLSSDHPERMEALEEVIRLCEEEEAKLLLISGDLFDKNVDVESLKTDVRPLFSDNDLQTYVIPGNHDEAAYRAEDHFGDDIEVLDETPFETREIEDVNIVGLPYSDKGFSELIDPLSESVKDNYTNILMIHCTLSGVSGGFGGESEYMPVRPEEFARTGFDYIFSGHIHSSSTKKEIRETTFTYPGSPVPISGSETGKRNVWVLDTEDETLETRKLDTLHNIRKEIELMPGEAQRIQETIESLEDQELDKARIKVTVKGFTDKEVSEVTDDLEEKLQNLEPESVEVENQGLENIVSITESEIYTEFTEKLEGRDLQKPEEVEKKFLRALSRYDRS